MRITLALTFICLAQVAQAHPGHLIEVAGHDHWVAGAAIALAGLAALWGALKGKEEEADEEAEIEDEDLEEAAA